MTTEVQFTKKEIERELAARSFKDFVSRQIDRDDGQPPSSIVKITEPPDAFGSGGGVIDFEMWPNLAEMIDLLGQHRLLNIMKARQVGLSWLIAAYALWFAMYHEGAVVLIFSQGQGEATALLGKIHKIWDNLPEWLQESIGLDNSTTIEFPGMNTKISALPSTEKAGRSETAALVIQDEADFHENIDANFAAVKPTIDSGDGQLIQISTVNKKKMLSLFKETFRNARKVWEIGDENAMRRKTNGFVATFYSWKVRPSRDQDWYDQVKSEAPDTAEMSADLYMEQEYPNSVEEALSPSRVMAAFDPDILRSMLDSSREPIETDENGAIRIFQLPEVGHTYTAGSDTAHGTGGDRAVTAVVDIQTGVVVADVVGNLLSPEEFARMSVNLLKRYWDPVWGIEDNDWGILTIRKAEELGYTNLSERQTPSGQDSGIHGWHTDERTRNLLYGELIEAIKQRLVILFSKDGIGDFMSVIRNPDKNGRIEAIEGGNDDYPIAVGIAWQLRKDASAYSEVTEVHKLG